MVTESRMEALFKQMMGQKLMQLQAQTGLACIQLLFD
jgi:hypothetical protein